MRLSIDRNLKVISHRGNLNGKKPQLENSPCYIKDALALGFDVEIDLWMIDDALWLGHDEPQYEIDSSFLKDSRLWIHCKNLQAVAFCSNNPRIRWFWHDTDRMTITSNGDIWCFPEVYLPNGITVMKSFTKDIPPLRGICTDYAAKYIVI